MEGELLQAVCRHAAAGSLEEVSLAAAVEAQFSLASCGSLVATEDARQGS